MSASSLQLQEVGEGRCYEVVALQLAPRDFGQDLPSVPGAVRCSSTGQPELLHIAPGRWLAPDPSPALLRALEGVAGVTLVDVEGKWRRLAMSGASAVRALRATIPLDSVLGGRDCAATRLFDCPAVLRRAGEGFEVWVHSSYLGSFRVAASAAAQGEQAHGTGREASRGR